MPSLPWRSPIQSWLGGLVLDRRFWTSFQPSSTISTHPTIANADAAPSNTTRPLLLAQARTNDGPCYPSGTNPDGHRVFSSY